MLHNTGQSKSLSCNADCAPHQAYTNLLESLSCEAYFVMGLVSTSGSKDLSCNTALHI